MKRLNKSVTKQKPKSITFEAIGTHWQIEYMPGDLDTSSLENSILARIEVFDRTYSRFRDDSLVRAMSQAAGNYEFPDDSQRLFGLYKLLYDATNGAVSPLVGGTLADAGYDAEYSLTFKRKTIAPDLEVLDIHKNIVTVKQPVLLDVGAAGKGYLVDIICELMKSAGVKEAIVDAGGDVATFSAAANPVDIALQHPADRELAVGVAHILNQSLCGSSIHLRNWGSHHHIIDPRTGESPTDIQAVWVVADSTLLADGLSTALFFTEPAHLRQHFSFEYAIIKRDDSLQYSNDFPATFFEDQQGEND